MSGRAGAGRQSGEQIVELVAGRDSGERNVELEGGRNKVAARLRRFAACAALLAALPLHAQQSPVGLWETIGDDDGKPKAHVRIVETDGELRATVEAILEPEKRDAVCDRCTDERRGRPVMGLTIVSGMRRDGDAYTGGSILDPKNGKVYSCRMRLAEDGKQLEVRGFLGISLLGRSQTWNRLESPPPVSPSN